MHACDAFPFVISFLGCVDSSFFQNGDFSSLDSRLEERRSVRALRRIDPQTRLRDLDVSG